MMARKRKNQRQDDDDVNKWYESVDPDATPDYVFRKEMERQRLLNQVPPSSTSSLESAYGVLGGESGSRSGSGSGGGVSSASPLGKRDNYDSLIPNNQFGIDTTSSDLDDPQDEWQTKKMDEKTIEATLAAYERNMVSDNWLDEQLLLEAWDEDQNFDDLDIDEENRILDEQIAQMELEDDEEEEFDLESSNEPWDHWGRDDENDDENDGGDDSLKMDFRKEGSDYFLNDDDNEDEESEEEYLQRLSKITLKSKRLENARQNPRAAAYFARDPDPKLGDCDRMWVSAIDNACFQNLKGTFLNYGIEFADNFGDWEDMSAEDEGQTIEDLASFKARQVYEVTKLPCIASRTSFDVEPVRTAHNYPRPPGSPLVPLPKPPRSAIGTQDSPRVTSGYHFNDISDGVDHVIDALKGVSEPTRVTRFKTCLCFFDGEMEVFDYGVCDVDMYYTNTLRTFIPVSSAISELCKTLQLTFSLEYQKWARGKALESKLAGGFGKAQMKLRDRVLKEGIVLPNDIIDVSAFMDSMVDVRLMDECGKELAEIFEESRPTKILTVATTGLVIALPMAKYLQVPVVYARKERNVVMADIWQASFSSKTVGKSRELLVSKSHIDEDDRILVVDDFLSSGSSQEALLRIISDAGATPVGVGVLLEKVYESGRQSLSGFDVPVESMVRVASVKDGIIQLMEEDGFEGL